MSSSEIDDPNDSDFIPESEDEEESEENCIPPTPAKSKEKYDFSVMPIFTLVSFYHPLLKQYQSLKYSIYECLRFYTLLDRKTQNQRKSNPRKFKRLVECLMKKTRAI